MLRYITINYTSNEEADIRHTKIKPWACFELTFREDDIFVSPVEDE
jgi:hypothetical protein